MTEKQKIISGTGEIKPMDKYIYRAKLDRVVDGDTIDALIDVGFDIWVKKRIRFMGLDTWECRTRNLEEKKKGLAAKARTKELLTQVTSKPGYFRVKACRPNSDTNFKRRQELLQVRAIV